MPKSVGNLHGLHGGERCCLGEWMSEMLNLCLMDEHMFHMLEEVMVGSFKAEIRGTIVRKGRKNLASSALHLASYHPFMG